MPGSPGATSTSTCTRAASMPYSVAELIAAYMGPLCSANVSGAATDWAEARLVPAIVVSAGWVSGSGVLGVDVGSPGAGSYMGRDYRSDLVDAAPVITDAGRIESVLQLLGCAGVLDVQEGDVQLALLAFGVFPDQ